MEFRIVRCIAACGAAVLLATGCGGSKDPGPLSTSQPTAAPSSAQDSGLPRGGAPKVPNPLPASALAGDPCQSMTPAQLKDALGQVQQTKQDSTPKVGPGCTWSNLDSGANLGVDYDTEVNTGLSGWYENTKPQATVWREVTVQGFPAVAHVTPSGGDSKVFCQLSIGISDEHTVDVSIGLSDKSKQSNADPCQVVLRPANVVIANLKQKAGS